MKILIAINCSSWGMNSLQFQSYLEEENEKETPRQMMLQMRFGFLGKPRKPSAAYTAKPSLFIQVYIWKL